MLEARAAGADLVLLIVAALDRGRARRAARPSASDSGWPSGRDRARPRRSSAASTPARHDRRRQRATSTSIVRQRSRDLGRLAADRIPAGVIRVAESAVDDAGRRHALPGRTARTSCSSGQALVTGRQPGGNPSASFLQQGRKSLAESRGRPAGSVLPTPMAGGSCPSRSSQAIDELAAAVRGGEGRPDVRRPSSRELHRSVHGPAVDHHRGAALRRARRRGPHHPQARGPQPHRVAQDQQRARPGAAHPPHRQDPRDRRDRRRSARRRHGDRRRAVRPRVHRLHGRGRHASVRRSTSPACASSAPR